MELSFVLAALRRRFWVVSLFAFLGALPGLLAEPAVSNRYRSVAELEIRQPTQGTGGFTLSPDRYVLGQLSELGSAALLKDVTDAVNAEYGLAGESALTVATVRDAVEIEQEPETDVVAISAVYTDRQVAQSIAQAYADQYLEGLQTESGDQAEIDRLREEILILQRRLVSLNELIQAEMQPWLDAALNAARRGDTPSAIPQPGYVAVAEVTEKTLAEAELRELTSIRNNLISNSRLRINTRIIQNATEPVQPLPAGGQFLLAGGLFVGAMLGVVAALAWARFSTKVLDEDTASEILASPVVSEFPHYRSLSRQPLAAFQALPRSAVPIVDQLCVLAEAKARLDQPLAVAVVGTQRGAGATTLALAMAERFAAGGSSVVLVDADVRDPRITAIFNANGDGGVPAVVANEGALIDERGRSVFTRTMDPEVSVLGLGPNRGQAALRRDTVASVLGAARRRAQVVIVDGGPALDLASTLQLANLADAVVLAVPLSRQKSDALADLSRQLDDVRHKLLPVVTSPARLPAKGAVVAPDGMIAVPGLSSQVGGGPADPSGQAVVGLEQAGQTIYTASGPGYGGGGEPVRTTEGGSQPGQPRPGAGGR